MNEDPSEQEVEKLNKDYYERFFRQASKPVAQKDQPRTQSQLEEESKDDSYSEDEDFIEIMKEAAKDQADQDTIRNDDNFDDDMDKSTKFSATSSEKEDPQKPVD